MPPEPSQRPSPLVGPKATADVFVLCQSAFWLRRHLAYDDVYAKRQALTVGLHALAGLKSPTICKIDLDHCDPERLTIRIRHHGNLVTTPITPALANLITQWIAVRPESVSKRLLADADGPVRRGTIDHAMKAMGKTFGIRAFADALVNFFRQNLRGPKAKAADAEAAAAYLGRGMGNVASSAAIARLIGRTDPFRGRARLFGNPRTEGAGRYRAKSALPATYDDCLPAEAFARGPRKEELADDHPLIAALAAARFPKNRRRAAETKIALYLQHRDAIEEILEAEGAPVAQFAKLFGMRPKSFARFRRKQRGKRAMREGEAVAIVGFADPVCLAYASVEKLLAVKWPKKREDRARVREPLFARYGEEIEELVACGRMLMREADALFGFAKAGFRKHLARLRAAAAAAPGGDRRGRPPTRRLAPDENARLAVISGLARPVGEALKPFTRDVLRNHAAFVCALIGAKKLRTGEGASLLEFPNGRVTLLRAEYAAGTLDLALADHDKEDRILWRELVLKQMRARPKRQGDVAFCIDLRRRFGMTLPFDFVRTVVRAAARRPAKPKRTPMAQPGLTAGEAKRLATIAAVKWTERGEDELRRLLLKEHFPFVFALIDARKLTMAEAGRLFRIRKDLMTQLRSDYRDGCFDWVLLPPVPADGRARWLDLVHDKWPKRPPGQTPNEFCRDLRKNFGFPLQFSSVNQVLARMRLHDPHETSNYSKAGRVKPRLTDADRALLERLRTTDWTNAADVGALRQELLRQYFPAVAAMVSSWKIGHAAVGRLFRLGGSKAFRLHREWREGTFDLVFAAPLSAAELAAWTAIVRTEIDARGGNIDHVTDFWHQLRRDRRLPISLNRVRHLVRTARAVSPTLRAA